VFEWTITYLNDEDILVIKTKGAMRSTDSNEMVRAIVDAAAKHQCLKHLVDYREMEFEFRPMEYYERPSVVEKLGVTRAFRTAMVFRQLTKETIFMETVFQNRGYQFRHFTDILEAKAWLKG